MDYIWLFHYALIQKLAKKRFKDFPEHMSLAAFAFLCIISVSIFAVFVDKNWLMSLYQKSSRLPIGPIFISILIVLLLPSYVYFSTRFSMKNKFKKIRNIIILRSKIRRIYSLFYIIFILFLFVLGLIFILFSYPIY
jgi:hypothetical protein